jgi:hypothetical protein
MKLYCPGCNTAIDGDAAIGVREMHCPECGIRFTVPDPAAAAARWGEVTTSKLAIISMLAGVGSLILPLCLCPFMLFGMTSAMAPMATRSVVVTTTQAIPVPPAPVAVPGGKPAQPVPPVQPAKDGGDDDNGSDDGATEEDEG